MRKVLLPVLLRDGKASRDQLKDEFVNFGEADSVRDAGFFMSLISQQMGMEKNDFLRQVIGYDYHPDKPWLKEYYYIRDGYEDIVREVLNEVNN